MDLLPATPAGLIAAGTAIIAMAMLVLWLVQLRTRDAGIVDVGWSFSLGFFACLLAAGGSGDPARRLLLAVLAGAWSLRLGLHLLFDRVLKGEEDGRYAMLRAGWGRRQQPYMFAFFQGQAVVAALFAIPFAVVAFNPRPLGPIDALAAATWIVAVAGEAIADRQLARFRADPRNAGKTCRDGLWAVSRHPNYFFEWIHWFTYLGLALGASLWWISLLGPVLMFVMLYRVTGIPYTEKRALLSRGNEYARYQRQVSAFVPWFTRKAGSP